MRIIVEFKNGKKEEKEVVSYAFKTKLDSDILELNFGGNVEDLPVEKIESVRELTKTGLYKLNS